MEKNNINEKNIDLRPPDYFPSSSSVSTFFSLLERIHMCINHGHIYKKCVPTLTRARHTLHPKNRFRSTPDRSTPHVHIYNILQDIKFSFCMFYSIQ